MFLGINGCDDVCEETRLLLIISAKFQQTGNWNEVATAGQIALNLEVYFSSLITIMLLFTKA
jgi:hypothetical protein